MNLSFEIAIIGFFQAVVVAVLGGVFARDSKKRKNAAHAIEERAKVRAEESRLSMKLMSASVHLGMATAIAIKEKKINGQMDSALIKAKETESEYYDFINGVAAGTIIKQ